MNEPEAPTVFIIYRNGKVVHCPVKYLGFNIPDGATLHYHCWRVLNEGPYDYRQGDRFQSFGGTTPHHIECPGTGPVDLEESA